jgi:hypothetical protein
MATNPYDYQSTSGPMESDGFYLTGYCSSPLCCALALCLDDDGCDSTTMSIEYTPPTVSSCTFNNQKAEDIVFEPYSVSGNSFAVGSSCQGVAGSSVSFDLSNPNGHLTTVVVGDGSVCSQNFVNYDLAVAPAALPKGTTARATAVRTRSASISLINAPCVTEPCCAIVWCHFDNGTSNPGGCFDYRYSYSAVQSVPTQPAMTPQLSVGGGIAIVRRAGLLLVLAT